MGALGACTRALGVLTALMAVAVGLAHVINKFDRWCHESHGFAGDTYCVGPALVWADGKHFVDDVNGPVGTHWRSVFTLSPNIFFDLWTPFFLGMITLLGMHLESTRVAAISVNWPRALVWYTFLAFFGCFGYAGSLGIITGFVAVFTAFLCLVCALAKAEGPPGAKLNRVADGYEAIA
eukprot:Hpha_TRINITY_DN16156_c3_g2::TRINITY_DN16156_c3_g2_i1::g.3484::m.3484